MSPTTLTFTKRNPSVATEETAGESAQQRIARLYARQREEFVALAEQHETVTNRMVVDYATNPQTALHQAFEWDNEVAGDRWRLHQASELIRRQMTVVTVAGERRAVRMMVSLSTDRRGEERGYRMMHDVMSDRERMQVLVRDCETEYRAFRQKYHVLSEMVSEVMQRVDAEREQATQVVMA